MLNSEENERLCRVGPGTPMGALMRRYWLPALLAWELPEPDCPPVRVRLLGEDLVAFRATDGSIGLLDEYCPHRGASLWLGRNEENGLRCVYHGWKFDATGQCTDQMNEPVQFAARIRATSYPTLEMGGIIWTYMGPPDKRPEPPAFDLIKAGDSQRAVSKVLQESNWLQALEGGIDSSHFTILHRALKSDPLQEGLDPNGPAVRAGPPMLEVDVTDYGYRYFASRDLDGSLYVRGYHFVMPFTQLRPPGPGLRQAHGHFWVPIDDENTMVWNWYYSYEGDLPDEREAVIGGGGNSYGTHVDASNGFRPLRNKSNDWMIDRAMQKTETFTGIDGINQQDRAVQESMGPIVDRSKEHLGPADKAIVTTRRLLREAMESTEKNADPRGVAPSYYTLRPAEKIFKPGEDWRAELLAMMTTAES